MHPEEIKAALRMSGWTQAMLADDLAVAPSSIAQAIAGSIRSERIQRRISQIINKPLRSIWPNQVVLRRSQHQIAVQRSATHNQEIAS